MYPALLLGGLVINYRFCQNCISYTGVCTLPEGKFFDLTGREGSACKYFTLCPKFVWSDSECNPRVLKGSVVFVGVMTKENAQRLVKDLSYCTGFLFDYYVDGSKTVIGVEEFNKTMGDRFISKHLSEILKEYDITCYL